jgi:uncharacterized coiled-coil DUF342 family protein
VPVVADSYQQVSDELDEIVGDPSLSAADKLKRLRVIGQQLESLQGKVESYSGDQRLVQEAASVGLQRRVMAMRSNADAFDHLVEQGHDADELRKQGFVTHQEIDQLQEEGLLEEAALQWPEGEPGDDEDLDG